MTVDQTPTNFDTIPAPHLAPWPSSLPASAPPETERRADTPRSGNNEPTAMLTGWPRVFPGL